MTSLQRMHSRHSHEFYIHRHAPLPLLPYEFVDGNIIMTSYNVDAINYRVMEESIRHVRVPPSRNFSESYRRRLSPRHLPHHEYYRVMEESMRHVRGPQSRNSSEPYRRNLPPRLLRHHEFSDENVILFPSVSNDVEATNINMNMEESMRSIRMVPASRTAIESLNKVKIEKDVTVEKCSICLEDFIEGMEVSAMPCKHMYHQQCITQWLETSHFCPLCRYSMSI